MRTATRAASVLAFAALVCSALPAFAQAPNPSEPKILLHISTPTTKGDCTTAFTSSIPNCGAAVTSAPLGKHFVYVVVARGDSMTSLAGVQLGITYQDSLPGNILDGVGIDMFSWKLCATLEFAAGATPVWSGAGAEPGAGNLITWDYLNMCQTGEIANAGYFYVAAYSDDRLRVIPRPVDGKAKVADCSQPASESKALNQTALGWVQFSTTGTAPGCNPCLTRCFNIVPVKATTWGNLKTMFD
jgi:hypothetical protein